MALLTLTPTKQALVWNDDGTTTLRVWLADATSGFRASRDLNIAIDGTVTPALGGASVGTLTAGQRTTLASIATAFDSLIGAADIAGKIKL
jgi:hypothetical protein